ncbi:MAG: TonB family protein [Duodenibacillus sp.]|nr:TonB family protein [Duodenibacillus sp.]
MTKPAPAYEPAESEDRLKPAFAISASLHLLALIMISLPVILSEHTGSVSLDLTSTEVRVSSPDSSVAIGSYAPGDANAQQAAEKRRQIYNRYIDEVAKEIHARRLDFGKQDLIGIATYSFSIDKTGAFYDIALRNSSGHKQLDEVAEKAIRAASAKVKRPKELGTDDIWLLHEVRFQYALK